MKPIIAMITLKALSLMLLDLAYMILRRSLKAWSR